MLVLSRKAGEHITLVLEDGREIDLTIVAAGDRGNKVRIGIKCDRTIEVYRSELMTEIRRQKQSAQATPGGAVPSG